MTKIEQIFNDATTALTNATTTVRGMSNSLKKMADDQIARMERWKTNFIYDELPVFNLVPNAKLDITDSSGNFIMFGFYWWISQITVVSSTRVKINDASWWKSERYALRLVLKGLHSDKTRYACLWGGAYTESSSPEGMKEIRTTRAFKYRIIANNGSANKVRIGWETGCKDLDMSISNDWREVSLTSDGKQSNALISFYLESDKEVTIEITDIRINLGNSARPSLPLNRLANLALRGE